MMHEKYLFYRYFNIGNIECLGAFTNSLTILNSFEVIPLIIKTIATSGTIIDVKDKIPIVYLSAVDKLTISNNHYPLWPIYVVAKKYWDNDALIYRSGMTDVYAIIKNETSNEDNFEINCPFPISTLHMLQINTNFSHFFANPISN